MYLEKRRRRWYAIHEIPEDVREIIGQGKQFFQSLETEERKTAERRAVPLKVRWLSEIEQARKGTRDHIDKDAAFWRKVLKEADEAQRDLVLDAISEERTTRVERAMERAGFTDYKEDGAMEAPGVEEAYRFEAVATGRLVSLDEHLEEWLATLSNEVKSKDMKKSTVLKFAETFPYVQEVKRKDVQRWVNALVQDEGKKAATVRRALSEVRGYWAYLMSIEVVPEDALPFEKLSLPKDGAKEAVRDERRAFTPKEVVGLVQAAEEKGDTQLADLIRLGMWTGARLEELCALKITSVGEGYFEVQDAKTAAGWRRVPIHPKLAPTMARLIDASKKAKDKYVMAGLSENKYGNRSNAIGKRFGRLKTDAKFGSQYVFHSIRHTVATMFKSLRVEEAIAADILGHEHDRITYGRYGDATYWQTLVDVVGMLNYDE